MKFRELFQKVGLTKVKIKLGFSELEWEPKDPDREAAWELYVEMLTRIASQPLAENWGDERVALESIYSLFPTTREILRRKGRNCIEFSKIAVPVLNQVVRPFTAKWHRLSLSGAFGDSDRCMEFRADLTELQTDLRNYTRLLATLAEVEDLTDLEGD
ncbi:MAG: hypothetical protein MUE60_12945 [Candidatus Eisenbacteria bacterium]|jgi:hypothetical protein|nr:hypothetical protein [Candidatus Eisenbacteria bacterium]